MGCPRVLLDYCSSPIGYHPDIFLPTHPEQLSCVVVKPPLNIIGRRLITSGGQDYTAICREYYTFGTLKRNTQ